MFAADLDNPWIAAAARAPRRARTAIVAPVCVGTIGALLFVGRALAPDVGAILANVVVFAGLALAAVIATRLEGRRLWPPEAYGAAALFGGLALGLGAVFACAAVASMAGAGGVLIGPPEVPVTALAVTMLVAALGAVAQEMFFRGWVQPVLCAAWGAWPGLFVTALAFAAFHVAAGAHGALIIANLLLAGLLLGLLALRSGGLAAPAATHLMWTWTGFAGLAGSPSDLPVQVRLGGAELWSGGAQGLGGSVAATVVLLVLLAAVLMVKPQIGVPASAKP